MVRLVVLGAELALLSTSGCAFQLPHTQHAPQAVAPSPLSRVNEPLYMSVDHDASSESAIRRQLLFSMLVSAGSTAFAQSAHATQDLVNAPADSTAAGTASTLEDWSNIKIMKPPLDDRDYLTYILDNGLKVVLCSDPETNEAGAAMDVHVGACSDPREIPGLAHFNEHMLFLGTKDYPKEDSFEEFLSDNGGASNAYTASEDTVYHFTLQGEEKLLEGLQRFGAFFTNPLFTESATGRELNAIESENAKNLQADNFRSYQLEKSRQNLDHPHSKFFTGNKKTLLDDTKKLGINLRDELIKFYSQHYSANQMTLAVVGPQSLETLQAMVAMAFGRIPNRNVPPPEEEWKQIIPPYDDTKSLIPAFGHVLKVVPVQDVRQVNVEFPILYSSDQDRTNALLTKQATYVAHLIGHEGPGSLLSYLKRKGWANSVSAGGESELSDFELFEVTIGLSKAGLTAVDQVVEALFSYINMLRSQPIPRYVYTEVLQLEELQWRYSSKGQASGYVQSLATSLQKYPPSLCVAGPRRLALCEDDNVLEVSDAPRNEFTSGRQFDFNRELTTSFIDNLAVDNSIVTILSKSFQGQTNEKEKWYGTPFSTTPIPETTMNQWRKGLEPKSLGVFYPKPNPFIPVESGLEIKYPPPPVDRFRKKSFEERIGPLPPPEIIRDDGPNGRWTVYYKADQRFGQPKAFVIIQLLTKEVYSTAGNAALSNLYEFALSDKLAEYAYDAGLAGLTYDLKVVPRGVRLTFGGYNDKLQKFASYIGEKVSSDSKKVLPKDDAEFERYKDLLSRTFSAFDVKQPYSHCTAYSQLATHPEGFLYSNSALREAADQATLDDLRSYVEKLWSSGKGIALVQGNLDEKEAQTLVSTLDKALGFKPISDSEYPAELSPLPLPSIPTKSLPTKLVISEPNPDNVNAASYVVIQSLSEDSKDHVMMEILSAIVSEPFYEDLRTKQQLGYIVSSGIRPLGKTLFMGFIAQSSVANTDKLTTEIIKYLDNVRPKLLDKLSKGDLAVYVKSLIDRKTEPDKQLITEVTRNWGEIASGRLQFDRVQLDVAAALDLTKQDLLNYWDQLYLNDGRRLLITEMIPKTGPVATTAPPTSTGFRAGESTGELDGPALGIDDIEEFRRSRTV